jgi:hypothetical protein
MGRHYIDSSLTKDEQTKVIAAGEMEMVYEDDLFGAFGVLFHSEKNEVVIIRCFRFHACHFA